ncbi:hypothetical protein FJ422_06500 [Mesorhizobium sp. B2-6-3]|nr:hypothetical protein FJW11_06930 [Mesorhizobium sp. B3-1-1]TPJ68901.1 hypothetical protein FJ462_11060 [Mesorhizobium sp. B2-6-7]TPJ87482.1 hypothetical protein FJ422_06500 [Mesorhizobium sp. B2-6-3]TPK00709.1 hypothetical protein FJ491_12100 [Mesorhizobium sp. B2-5-10]TPK12523.1 hypothetical protein FJ490_09980 [Mesorhizobium sp. B2-5-11]TPK33525.1 hypothetical protein FJ885_12280 [Mesorhizobium sp. B2-5-8]
MAEEGVAFFAGEAAIPRAPSGLPAISPTRGEIGCRDGFRQFLTLTAGRDGEAADLPLVGEMPGRAEGGAVPPTCRSSHPAKTQLLADSTSTGLSL